MVEPGGLEAVAELVGEPFVLAQHDPREQRPPLPVQPRGDRTRDVRAKSIGDAADASAPADDAPVAAVEHDVNATAGEPAALVEPVFGAARSVDLRPEGEDGALRRRAADGQLEQDALVERAAAEPAHLGGYAQREGCLPHGAGDHRGHRRRAADLGLEQAAIERSEPLGAEPPAARARAPATQAGSRARGTQRSGRRGKNDEAEHEHGSAHGVRQRQAETRGEHDAVWASGARSRRHELPQLLDARGPDAGDRVEVVDRAEAAVRERDGRRSSAP